MSKVGIATLPLHNNKAPYWLLKRMVMLGKPIFKILYEEEGPEGIIRRLSDTYWFQGLSCILGFDWHSSGCTTVLGGVLKQIISAEQYGLIVAGGKGKNSLKVKEHLQEKAKTLDYSEDDIENLSEISRIVAKVDNAAIQDGFSLYHHIMIVSEYNWGIIQQGLDISIKKARRYHWLSEGLNNFLNNPHSDISTECFKDKVLNMASKKSNECRKISLNLIAEGSTKIKKYLKKLKNRNQTSLDDFIGPKKSDNLQRIPHLNMPIPFTLKWESIDMAKELAINDYAELLKIKGLGPGLIRALALISEFIWGTPPSWKDPAKYAFTVGGKDGIPYPVNLKRMEVCAHIFEDAIDRARINQKDRLNALKRLHKYKRKYKII
ncbi:MAG: DUF763 domain-containing protein [Promethearchaeota archaeon]